jgi:hypothetical protein
MCDLVTKLAAQTGISRDLVQKGLGAILAFLKKELGSTQELIYHGWSGSCPLPILNLGSLFPTGCLIGRVIRQAPILRPGRAEPYLKL